MIHVDLLVWCLLNVLATKLVEGSIMNATCHEQTTSLNVTWENSSSLDSTIISYHARLKQDRKTKPLFSYNLPKTATSVQFTQLSPVTTYLIKISAHTQSNEVIKTHALRCRTLEGVPEKVVNLRATAKYSSSVLVQWVPPFRINGFLQGYQVNISDGAFKESVFVKGKQSLLMERLQEDTVYSIQVSAVNGKTMGATSMTSVKTKEIPIIRSRPKGLTIATVSWNSVRFSWAPMDPAIEVNRYEARVCRVNEGHRCAFDSTNQTTVAMGDLLQNMRYRVDIRAVNKRSQGPWVGKDVITSDLDECTTNAHSCGLHGLCQNTLGSYLCSCFPGYLYNGSDCIRFEVDSRFVCPYQIADGITWYSVLKGKHASALCPDGTMGVAKRYCDEKGGTAFWNSPNFETCTSHRLIEIQEKLSAETLSSGLVRDLTSDLLSATNIHSDLPMYGGDLNVSVNILKHLESFAAKNPSHWDEKSLQQLSSDTVAISSNILDDSRIRSWEGIPKKSRIWLAMQLVDVLESITLATSSHLKTQGPVVQKSANVIANMQSFSTKDWTPKHQPVSSLSTENCSVLLPVGEVMATGINSTQVSFVYLTNIGRLLSPDAGNQTTSNQVVSVSTRPKFVGTFQTAVVIVLRIPKNSENTKTSCVFWDLTSQPPSWSSDGCHVSSNNDTFTTCHCNHLTSFSVLMQHIDPAIMDQENTLVLSLITYIGISISIAALLVAFITFCICPFLKSTRNFAHINLTLSLLLAEVLFLAGIDKTEYILPCQIISVVLHYLFLVVFCWMASEGIILYFMLVRVFPSESSGPRRRLFFICSWGLPCIFVGLSSALYPQGYRNRQHCWLTIQDRFIWSFLTPVILISVVNLVVLVLTFKAMANRLTPQAVTKERTFKYWTKAWGVITCLLGTTWVLGLFYVNSSSIAMAYLFNILNSFQGTMIFVFHCVFDERVRAEYVRLLCCRGSRRDRLRKQSTDLQSSRKTSQASGKQKYSARSIDEKGTTSRTMSSLTKNETYSGQDALPACFDSDSLLTINKTSTEGYVTTEEIHDSREFDKKITTGEDDPPRPLSFEAFKSLRRSKEYHSDSDCVNYCSDALTDETSHSNDELWSHPRILTDKGRVMRLGRCQVCSNDCYHMVYIRNEDELTLDSFDYVEQQTDEPGSGSVSKACISFDESVLAGFLGDELTTPKEVNHRWTHMPYIKKKGNQPSDFLSESSSCDDRFLLTRQTDKKLDCEECGKSDRNGKPSNSTSTIILISPLTNHNGVSSESHEEINNVDPSPSSRETAVHDLPVNLWDGQITLTTDIPCEDTTPSDKCSPTVPRREMTPIKEGIVRRLGQVYEARVLILHPFNNDSEGNNDSSKRTDKKHERISRLLPGKVQFLRSIFEDQQMPADQKKDTDL